MCILTDWNTRITIRKRRKILYQNTFVQIWLEMLQNNFLYPEGFINKNNTISKLWTVELD